jgi:hypothetical protein
MKAFEVVGDNPSTGEKERRYPVSEEKKALLGRGAEFEQAESDPDVYVKNKSNRSTAFEGWRPNHKWKAESQHENNNFMLRVPSVPLDPTNVRR